MTVLPFLLLIHIVLALGLLLPSILLRPNLRRLVGVRAAFDDRIWAARARRQRCVSHAMAGLTGAVGLLICTKPDLW